jgi:hypothetical protein
MSPSPSTTPAAAILSAAPATPAALTLKRTVSSAMSISDSPSKKNRISNTDVVLHSVNMISLFRDTGRCGSCPPCKQAIASKLMKKCGRPPVCEMLKFKNKHTKEASVNKESVEADAVLSLSPSLHDDWMRVGVECEIRMDEPGMLGSFECVTIIAINKATTTTKVTVEYLNLFDDKENKLIEETSVRQLRPKCKLLIPDLFVESLQVNSKCQMHLNNSSWWTMKVVSKSSSEVVLSCFHYPSYIHKVNFSAAKLKLRPNWVWSVKDGSFNVKY